MSQGFVRKSSNDYANVEDQVWESDSLKDFLQSLKLRLPKKKLLILKVVGKTPPKRSEPELL